MRSEHLPDVREKNIEKACLEALELGRSSTQVAGWHAHPYGDDRAGGRRTVRGPFNRWFWLDEGNDNDRNGKSQGCLADPEADILFASYAMNNIRSISKAYLDLRVERAKTSQALYACIEAFEATVPNFWESELAAKLRELGFAE